MPENAEVTIKLTRDPEGNLILKIDWRNEPLQREIMRWLVLTGRLTWRELYIKLGNGRKWKSSEIKQELMELERKGLIRVNGEKIEVRS